MDVTKISNCNRPLSRGKLVREHKQAIAVRVGRDSTKSYVLRPSPYYNLNCCHEVFLYLYKMQDPNEKLILDFYQAFQKGNPKGMNACYHKDIVFYDPVFGHLKGDRVRAMWYMLLKRGRDELSIRFSEIQANNDSASARWIASYYYGPNKRRVINEVVSTFYIQNGKILQHTDHFDLWKWSRQALGFKGYLLGWTKTMKHKIQQESSRMLSRYIHKMRSLEEDVI